MKKTIFLLVVLSVVSIASAETVKLNFDGEKSSKMDIKESLALIVPTQPAIPETALIAGKTKTAPQNYSAEFFTENEANLALPVIVKKFETVGCVILTSRVSSSMDGANDIHWYVELSYLPASGLTSQSYSYHFYSENEASQALTVIAKKFEAAGCVVLTSGVRRDISPDETIYWDVELSYLTKSGLIAQNYSNEFSSENEARQALPGIAKKFEAAGYVVLVLRVWKSIDAAYDAHWYGELSYIQAK